MPLDYVENADLAGQASAGILSSLYRGTVATAADMVGSIYNSTAGLLGADDLNTRDILKKVDKDALAFYDEHEDGVKAASFIAGMIIPGTVTMKLLQSYKNGAMLLGRTRALEGLEESAGFVTQAKNVWTGRKAELLTTELKTMYEAAKYDTLDYNRTLRKLYASKAGENIIDAVILEGVLVGTMNAHPYMEEYKESPFKSALISIALGGGIGSALGIVAAKTTVRTALGEAATKAKSLVAEAQVPEPVLVANAERYQAHGHSINNLEALKKTDLTELQKTEVEETLIRVKAHQELMLYEIAPFLKPAEKGKENPYTGLRGHVEEMLMDNKFIGVQKINLPNLKGANPNSPYILEFDVIELDKARKIAALPEDPNFVGPVFKTQDTGTVYYRPSTGNIFHKEGAANAGMAVDLKDYKLNMRSVDLYKVNNEFDMNNVLRAEASGWVDAQFMDEIHTWQKVKDEALDHIVIGPTDLPRMHGFMAWAAKHDPATLDQIKVNLTSTQATYDQMQKVMEATMKPGYEDRLRAYVTDRGTTFDAHGLSVQAKTMLDDWVGGGGHDKAMLRRAFDRFFRGTSLPHGEQNNARVAEELWRAGAKFRELMRKEADSEGFVRLYRGMDSPDKGSTTASFTTRPDVSRRFGTSRLYKIHVDDIIGNIGNIRMSEAEVLVGTAAHRTVEKIQYSGGGSIATGTKKIAGETVQALTDTEKDMLSAYTKMKTADPVDNNIVANALTDKYGIDIYDVLKKQEAFTEAMTSGTKTEATEVFIKDAGSSTKVSPMELKRHLEVETERQIRDLAKNEFGIEEISIRTNATQEAVIAVMAGESLSNVTSWARLASVEDTKNAMLVSNRMVTLTGNPHVLEMNKVIRANMDDKTMRVGHEQMVRLVAAKHNNPFVNAIIDKIYGGLEEDGKRRYMQHALDTFRENLGEVNNILVKSPAWQSADMMLRHLKDSHLLTALGKEMTRVQDEMIKQFIEPLSTTMRAGFQGNTAAMHEFANVINVNARLSGWRDMRIDPEFGYAYLVQREIVKGKTVETAVKNKDGTTFYITQKAVINTINASREVSTPILGMHNFYRELRGQPKLNDLGLYLPPTDLRNKYISYIIDPTGKQKTMHLIANSAEELKTLEANYRTEVISKHPELTIVSKGLQKDWNVVNMYTDAEPYVTIANNQLKHGGTALAHPPADARVFEQILSGFEHQIIAGMRKTQEVYLSDITQRLDMFSKLNQRFEEGQPTRGFFKKKAEDAALSIKNVLLGISQRDQMTTWKMADDFTSMMLERTTQGIDRVASTFNKNVGSREYFDALNKEFKEKGITPPWESFELYTQSLGSPSVIKSQRMVSVMNGMLSFMQIRAFDMAHVAVNLASLPILSHAALMEGLPATQLSNGARIKLPARLMYDAIAFEFSPKGKQMEAVWEKMKALDQVTMLYRDMTGSIHTPINSKGAASALVDKMEAFQNSDAAKIITKPADYTERATRAYAMRLGYLAAKHAYPGIDDTGATLHALAMADRIVGNYHSAQRPGIFQGTLGTALGLYQTYMTTFAQSVYRNIERGQFRNLASMAAVQAGIFGTSSWPGYQLLSNAIGEHMSNENYDLTTGTYRALGNPLAELVLYGMPSMMGPNLSTRGAINPRIPTSPADLAIVNTVQGIWNSLGHTMNGLVNQPGIEGKLQAVLEGLSLQSVSRPVARLAEIAAGESITQKGHTVSNSDDVWTFTGVMSRLLATRPLEEQVTRDAMHLNSFYGAADRESRGNAVRKLRIAIRAGKLDDETISSVASTYLRQGGSGKGWDSVMNEILVRTEEGTSYELLRKLEPTSPLRRMISDNY